MKKPFEGAISDWKFIAVFSILSLIFLLLELAYQLYFAGLPDVGIAMVRGFALAGATFIALSLFTSIIFKFYPLHARHWPIRRGLGVVGVLFATMHIISVYNFYFGWDVLKALTPFNPIENPRIFGLIAYSILFILFLTSTDWAIEKLKAPRWKMLHRLVYFSFWALVAHFMLINPVAIMEPPGYLLIGITLLTLAGELYWFVKIASRNSFRGLASIVGFTLILLYLALGYLLYVTYLG